MRRLVPMPAGSRYGSLVVLHEQTKPIRTLYGDRNWWAVECACDCGNVLWVIAKNLRSGNTKSCGCRSYLKRRTA